MDRGQARKRSIEWMVTTLGADGRRASRPDQLVTEEPMEIRVQPPGAVAEAVSVTMRTPGNDFELAVGFLFTEGVVATADDVRAVRYCELEPGVEQTYNVVTVAVARPATEALSRRALLTTASCGICGTESIDRLMACSTPIPPDRGPVISPAALLAVADDVRRAQPTFSRTGGLHAAALFDSNGKVTLAREDIGRHNAVDKVVGRMLLDRRIPIIDQGLFCSGRLSYEIIQKAAMAGVALVVAVGAPSSLAVETADALGITTVGFLRDGRANVYTHPGRVAD